MKHNQLLLVKTMAFVLAAQTGFATEVPSRSEFVKLLARINVGETQEKVAEVLGMPSAIVHRTRFDGTIEDEWQYGVDTRSQFATLGRVVFVRDFDTTELSTVTCQVIRVYGGKGEPPSGKVIAEKTLREALGHVSAAPLAKGREFSPRAMIGAVNTLRMLGKDVAFAVIEEYLRLETSECLDIDASERVLLLARVLFDMPKTTDSWPEFMAGASSPPPPRDRTAVPRFPIIVVDDVPLCIVSGYASVGPAESPEADLAVYKRRAILPKRLLVPPDNPLGIMKKCDTILELAFRPSIDNRALIAMQLLRFDQRHTFRDANAFDAFARSSLDAKSWDALKGDFGRRQMKWDANKLQYIESRPSQ